MSENPDFFKARDDFWAAFERLQQVKRSGTYEEMLEASADLETVRAPFKQQVNTWISESLSAAVSAPPSESSSEPPSEESDDVRE
jgi:hypothetical protein